MRSDVYGYPARERSSPHNSFSTQRREGLRAKRAPSQAPREARHRPDRAATVEPEEAARRPEAAAIQAPLDYRAHELVAQHRVSTTHHETRALANGLLRLHPLGDNHDLPEGVVKRPLGFGPRSCAAGRLGSREDRHARPRRRVGAGPCLGAFSFSSWRLWRPSLQLR